MKSHSDIIDELGGYAKLAEALDLPKGTVSAFKTRNSIPSEHWQAIERIARENGKPEVTLAALVEASPPRQKRTQAGAPA